LEKVVFVNGCFDLLHFGHIKFLKNAAAYGTKLIVGINSDLSIKLIKGPDRPVLTQSERRDSLLNLDFIDNVYIFDEDNPARLIQDLKPDVVVKSSEYKNVIFPEKALIRELGSKLVFVDQESGISTTEIINRIKNKKC
jgi:rfaE bifunctional protein nucleotidyltransferase chain/domain